MSENVNGAVWRKSSYSSAEGNCVEVAELNTAVGVRDSKNRDGGALRLERAAWAGFVADTKAGRYDLR
jgi:Domain of unknown function (DUF397)